MDLPTNRNRLIVGVALGAVLFGGGGIILGRTAFAPTPTIKTGAAKPEVRADRGADASDFVGMTLARAQAAGVATEVAAVGALEAEVIAQGVVTSTPEGEAALTARGDGAVVRITKRLGDSVRAGEAVAILESRDASTIAAERSKATAKVIAARATYARERHLFAARVTARQDLEAAAAGLAEAEAELRRTSAAASAARVSGDGRSLAVVSLISGRVTKVSTQLGAYALAGAELFRVSDPTRIQINASVLPADARRIRPGDKAVVELLGGETMTATVRSATPSLDPESRTATLVLLPAGVGGLSAGQGLRVRITPRERPGTSGIALPSESVQSVEGRDVVFVRTLKGFKATPVTIGTRSRDRVNVVAGLNAGSVVATKGAFLLKAELGKSGAEE